MPEGGTNNFGLKSIGSTRFLMWCNQAQSTLRHHERTRYLWGALNVAPLKTQKKAKFRGQ
jgi:hypothetical protein